MVFLHLIFDPGILGGCFHTLARTRLGLGSTGGIWYLVRSASDIAATC